MLQYAINDTLAVCGKLPFAITMAWLRLTMNLWPTSRRFSDESVRPCPFCRSPSLDDVRHFMFCNSLWSCAILRPPMTVGKLAVAWDNQRGKEGSIIHLRNIQDGVRLQSNAKISEPRQALKAHFGRSPTPLRLEEE